MKTQKPQHVGNITLAYDAHSWSPDRHLFLVKKAPKGEEDRDRVRKRVGIGKRCLTGGGRDPGDRSHKQGAQRELFEESGNAWKIPLGNLYRVGVIESYRTVRGFPRSFEHATLKWVVHLYETIIPEHLLDKHGLSEGIVETGWFSVHDLPWSEMMDDSKLWIPRMIDGEQLRIRILRHYKHEKLMEHQIITEQFS
ncbi:MAG: NUDIX domain-containing protein [Patescibacteria group bacterium]